MLTRAQLGVLALAAAALVGSAIVIIARTRRSPAERERRRRLAVSATGRLGDAMINDVAESVIYYSYTVRGVEYHAAQDVSSLADFLPVEPDRLIGLASLKYHTNNPANSIVVCETWSGLRAPVRVSAPSN